MGKEPSARFSFVKHLVLYIHVTPPLEPRKRNPKTYTLLISTWNNLHGTCAPSPIHPAPPPPTHLCAARVHVFARRGQSHDSPLPHVTPHTSRGRMCPSSVTFRLGHSLSARLWLRYTTKQYLRPSLPTFPLSTPANGPCASAIPSISSHLIIVSNWSCLFPPIHIRIPCTAHPPPPPCPATVVCLSVLLHPRYTISQCATHTPHPLTLHHLPLPYHHTHLYFSPSFSSHSLSTPPPPPP